MQPLVTVTLTLAQLRAYRRLMVDSKADALLITVEFEQAGETKRVDQPIPLTTIDRLIAQMEAVERAARN